ncbi:MAG TPA: DUF480 domain-containing protein, partial [Aquabacterium sp.]|nr:DUF480 domain-containing protein [Aquabacterium sp.]
VHPAGEREARWAHLLCGEPVLPVAAPVRADGDLHAEMASLKAEVADLKTLVHRLARELGIETSNEDLT